MAYTKVKSAWQNESGMYAVKTMYSNEEPKIVSEDELEKLMELMGENYSWIIVENPIYQNQLKQSEYGVKQL